MGEVAVDTRKLAALLDDPEVRVLVYGLAHAYPGQPSESGAQRLRAAIQHLAGTVDAEQVQSWLSDEPGNRPITVTQVRKTFGDKVIQDMAGYAGCQADEVTWQLTSVLPDLVDALSPGGVIADASEIQGELITVRDDDQGSAGPFGPSVH